MKSILFEVVTMAVACVACAILFCGLQCVMLSAHVYESLIGSDA